MNIKEMNGVVFKKYLNLNSCRFAYHNKNNNGGNFGLDFYLKEEFDKVTDFTLNGDYDKNGNIIKLCVDSIRCGAWCFTISLERIENISELKEVLKNFYKQIDVVRK